MRRWLAERTCARSRCLGRKEEKKAVLVDTLPSAVTAPPAVHAQVRVTMLRGVLTLVLLLLAHGEPAHVRRVGTAAEGPGDPRGKQHKRKRKFPRFRFKFEGFLNNKQVHLNVFVY